MDGLLTLTILRCSASHHKCIFGCRRSTELKTVPCQKRKEVLIQHRYYLPQNVRCCKHHLNERDWYFDVGLNSYNSAQVEDMVDLLRSIQKNNSPALDFEYIEYLSDEIVQQWTGISADQFIDLAHATSLFNLKRGKTALALYLAKLRTGETDERLSNLFQVSYTHAKRLMSLAREAVKNNFLPKYLGFNSIDRIKAKNHITNIARKLFCNNSEQIITIWDATYIYIQKSSNYQFQRKSFSVQKKRQLIKPMMIVAPDGYIIEVLGPYKATMNDATILNSYFQTQNEQCSFFKKDDIFLLDRGFRDSIQTLQSMGYKPKVPAFISKSEKQLDWYEANTSRFVTKCRYVVEVENGKMKQIFRYFDKVWQNISLPHLMCDFKNAAALLNAYFSRIYSDNDDSEEIADLMLSRLNEPNTLAEYVIGHNLNRKAAFFEPITSTQITFPVLSDIDLKQIALGTYQLKQAKSYFAEHVSQNGKYIIEVCKDVESLTIPATMPVLIRGRLQSRHFQRTKYFLYILIDLVFSGKSSLIGYYCQCKNGKRTVGTCAHIMTVIWYLGNARNNNDIKEPAAFLNNFFGELAESSASENEEERT